MPVTLTIRSFCSACFGLMCFLMVQCSTSLSLCRSWLREPLRFLEFCSSIYRPGSTSLFCLLPRTCIFGHVISFAVSTCNRLQPYKLEVWEWVVKRRIFDLFCEFSRWVWFVSGFSKSAYTARQGGLVLWHPLSPVATLSFIASVPSSYLAGVIACLTDECLAPSFRRHLERQAATNTRACNF